jgi:hypothetical protein
MFKGWWHVLPDDERQQWVLDPFVAVGPLRFGMSPAEVADAMSGATAESGQRTTSWPAGGGVSAVVEEVFREFGLHLYYKREHLAGVVVDALCGPQVFVDGVAVVGQVPSVVEQWLLDRADTLPPYTELEYMSAGVPGSLSLGVTVNVQREGDRLLTRPVFYPAEAIDDLSHWLPREAWSVR